MVALVEIAHAAMHPPKGSLFDDLPAQEKDPRLAVTALRAAAQFIVPSLKQIEQTTAHVDGGALREDARRKLRDALSRRSSRAPGARKTSTSTE